MNTNYKLAALISFMFLSSCSISNNFGKQQTKGLKHSGRHFSKDKIVIGDDEIATNTELNQVFVIENFDDIADDNFPASSLEIDFVHDETHAAKAGENAKPRVTNHVKHSYPIQTQTSDSVKYPLKTKISNDIPLPNEAKADGFGIASLIIAIAAFLLPIGWGILFCIVALVFAAISLSRILNQPDKYTGTGLAITALVLSLIALPILLILAG